MREPTEQERAHAYQVLESLLSKPGRAPEIAERIGLNFDQTYKALEWLHIVGWARRIDRIPVEPWPEWVVRQ